MAAMKHGKSRKQRQSPVFPGAGRGDRDLREMLAKEYGVEAPPRSFHKNFEKRRTFYESRRCHDHQAGL